QEVGSAVSWSGSPDTEDALRHKPSFTTHSHLELENMQSTHVGSSMHSKDSACKKTRLVKKHNIKTKDLI
ncbi:MAG: hypothetical protein Q8P67_04340, partial [archaeon]|nr:hypothetical protein [archaeon]